MKYRRILVGMLVAMLLVIGLATPAQAVDGEVELVLLPESATNPVGTDHTVTAMVMDNGFPLDGILIEFEVVAGPNIGKSGSDETTIPTREATFTYTGDGGPGMDIIQAIEHQFGLVAEATKDWVEPGPPPRVPGMTVWGILAAVVVLAGLMLVVRRIGLVRSR